MLQTQEWVQGIPRVQGLKFTGHGAEDRTVGIGAVGSDGDVLERGGKGTGASECAITGVESLGGGGGRFWLGRS